MGKYSDVKIILDSSDADIYEWIRETGKSNAWNILRSMIGKLRDEDTMYPSFRLSEDFKNKYMDEIKEFKPARVVITSEFDDVIKNVKTALENKAAKTSLSKSAICKAIIRETFIYPDREDRYKYMMNPAVAEYIEEICHITSGPYTTDKVNRENVKTYISSDMLNQPAKEKSDENNEVSKYFQDDTDKLAEEKEQDIDDKINEIRERNNAGENSKVTRVVKDTRNTAQKKLANQFKLL